jgi:hypothetical protein
LKLNRFPIKGIEVSNRLQIDLGTGEKSKDPTQFPCDPSIARDLASQVVLSYITLTEDSPITVRVDAKFDNPNDDDGICLPDQGLISGSFTQKQLRDSAAIPPPSEPKRFRRRPDCFAPLARIITRDCWRRLIFSLSPRKRAVRPHVTLIF